MIEKCKYFEECSAPLCPKDEESLKYGIWYKDEEICKLKFVDDWIKKQRKIAKKDKDGFTVFTYKMLCHNCILSTIGIDSDKNREIEEKKWMNKHTRKKKINKEKRQKIAEKLKAARSKK